MNCPVQMEGVPDEVIRELCQGAHAADVFEAHAAKARQEEAEWLSTRMRATDGIGAPVANIDSANYHGWARRFGTYDCWKDGHFKRYFARKNPESVVRGFMGTRTQIQCGWERAGTRFSKRYEDRTG